MSAGYFPFLCEQGATFSELLTWTDSSGAAVDLTGFTARMQVRPKAGSATLILSLSSPASGIVLGGAAGTIQLLASAVTTNTLTTGPAFYDLELESASGAVTRLLEGPFTISGQVTT